MYEEFISKRIYALREQKNISARDLSLSLGQNRNYINQIESGKALPSMQVFFYICEFLNITPKEFFDEDVQNPLAISLLLTHLNGLSEKQIENITEIVKDMKK